MSERKNIVKRICYNDCSFCLRQFSFCGFLSIRSAAIIWRLFSLRSRAVFFSTKYVSLGTDVGMLYLCLFVWKRETCYTVKVGIIMVISIGMKMNRIKWMDKTGMTKCSAHTHIMNCYLYSYAFLRPDCAGGTPPSSHSSVFMHYYGAVSLR